MIAGDQARVSVAVAVERAEAFRIFTEEIDQWWRRGSRYRVAGRRPGALHLEPRTGGRLFESIETPNGEQLIQTGEITVWQPPERFVLDWRATNFAANEKTEVEVTFETTETGTTITVTHRGFSKLRPDHPVRHNQEAAAFIRTMGLWWAALLTSLREHAST